MRKPSALGAFLLFTLAAWAAGPEATFETPLATFRVTTAEVHVTFTAAGENNQPITSLAASDFVLLRDGSPVNSIVSFRSYSQQPLSALVLTDISDSMAPAIPMNRAATDWLRQHAHSSSDHLVFTDFGMEVENGSRTHNRHLTSLFDALVQTLLAYPSSGSDRRALIVLTDGIDNDSYHSLQDAILAAQRKNITMYAITAHPGKKQRYNSQVLQSLCVATGGKYYEVSKPDAMIDAIADINRELRSAYEVVFRPDMNAGFHQLKIQPNDSHLHFLYRSAYFQPAQPTGEMAAGQ